MISSKIYFDNNATTKIDNEVLNVMMPYLKEKYGNPSSIYSFGADVKSQIKNARKNVAKLLNADLDEIVFTSGASESNATAIMNAVRNNPGKNHIITTKVEHASIIEILRYLELKENYKVTYLSVDKQGKIDIEELKNSITNDTCLICVMMANNELGNIYPIKEIGEIAKEKNVLFHTDAVQAVGKVKINVKELNINTLSFSGHKIHAPKGIGVLYIKKETPFIPLIFGHQEKNRRGGTENAPYIIGLGKACEIILKDDYKKNETIRFLRDKLENMIKQNIKDVVIYGDIENRVPNTISVGFKGVDPIQLMLILEGKNIYVSTGSACNSEIAEPSYVLTACHADTNNYGPIRISLNKENTEEEIDTFIKILKDIVKEIRR